MASLRLDTSAFTSILFEVFFFGFYTLLFIAAARLVLSKSRVRVSWHIYVPGGLLYLSLTTREIESIWRQRLRMAALRLSRLLVKVSSMAPSNILQSPSTALICASKRRCHVPKIADVLLVQITVSMSLMYALTSVYLPPSF